MKLKKEDLLLYVVTDRTWLGKKNLAQQVEDTIAAGATLIQLREKELSFDDFVAMANDIKERCQVPIIINDDVDVAIAVNADGVHIGQSDEAIKVAREKLGSDKIIGVSAHNVEEAKKAEKSGADYIGVGAVFPTSTKTDVSTVSYETLKEISEAVDIPIVAIGGITKDNIAILSGSGIDGVAVISAIFAQPDMKKATKELVQLSREMVNGTPEKILTIAGSDCSGGAGIQADIKTIAAHKMYAMSVITALTAQNTTGVFGVMETEPEFVASQMDAVFTDIYPDAVKIGMVSNKTIIAIIADKLQEYEAKHIVLDPVMISTSGSKLLKEDAMEILISKLMPLASVITPNILEAECLCGFIIDTKDGMEKAAVEIAKQFSGDILIKGGHLTDCSDDLLYTNGKMHWFEQENINNPNTHGTGCTLSSAIACNLAKGNSIVDSISLAKAYITGALRARMDLGKGSGPLDHGWDF